MRLKIGVLILIIVLFALFINGKVYSDDQYLSYVVDSKKQDLKLFLKNENAQTFKSIQNLKVWIEKKNRKLVFAMNGGMFKKDNSPQGLYIEKQKILSPLDTTNAEGNFYLKPNGVFYLTTENVPKICITEMFHNNGKVAYATQSGPMLVIENQINPAFKKGSPNLNIRKMEWEFCRMVKWFLFCRKRKLIFMNSQSILRILDVKMLYIWMDLYHGPIYHLKIGFRLTEILVYYLQ